MNGRSTADRDIEDMADTSDFRLAGRIFSSLLHPDCPIDIFEFEAKKLARHIAIRLNRTKPTTANHRMPKRKDEF